MTASVSRIIHVKCSQSQRSLQTIVSNILSPGYNSNKVFIILLFAFVCDGV
jgi:hypothetical protein